MRSSPDFFPAGVLSVAGIACVLREAYACGAILGFLGLAMALATLYDLEP